MKSWTVILIWIFSTFTAKRHNFSWIEKASFKRLGPTLLMNIFRHAESFFDLGPGVDVLNK